MIGNGKYIVLTLHRPSNVDNALQLSRLLTILNNTVDQHRILFPIHPRTRKVFETLEEKFEKIRIVDPMGYLEFIYTIQHSSGVVTDSGGITEETSILNIPCITLRDSTERPETITLGTNELIRDPNELGGYVSNMVAGKWKQTQPIKFWDGRSAERIMEVLAELETNKAPTKQVYTHG